MKDSVNSFYEEEFDLLEWVAPLLKYKLQLLLVFLGGMAVLWWGNQQVVDQTKRESERTQQVVDQTKRESERTETIKEILKLTRQPTRRTLEVVDVEYGKTGGKDFYKMREMDIRQMVKMYWNKGMPFRINLKATTTQRQYVLLKEKLDELRVLDKDIVALSMKKYLEKIQFFQKTFNSSNAKAGAQVKDSKMIESQYEHQIEEKELRKSVLVQKIDEIVFDIARPFWGTFGSNKQVNWYVFANAWRSRPTPRFDLITAQSLVRKLGDTALNEQELQEKLKLYIKKNKLKEQIKTLNMPILTYTFDSDRAAVSTLKKDKISLIQIVSIVLIAIVSVYCRVGIFWLISTDKSSEGWGKLISALKYWKL